MTQCLLSRVLISNHPFNRHRLQLLYEDCLEKDQVLDQNFHRREIPSNYPKTFFVLFFHRLMKLFSLN